MAYFAASSIEPASRKSHAAAKMCVCFCFSSCSAVLSSFAVDQ